MRALFTILGLLGTAAGVVLGVVSHRRAAVEQGWTLYSPGSTRYADFLVRPTPWFPGILEYALIGLGAGLLVALVLAALRFRLVRSPGPPPTDAATSSSTE